MSYACYPKAQEKVQEHLDIVIGPPTIDDYNSLLQIEAFILERLLWRPVFAHCASTDIVYGNLTIRASIPTLTSLIERSLNSEGKIQDDLHFPSYGFGRGTRPGWHIVNHSVFINVALPVVVKITQDPKNPIDEMSFVGDVIAHPKPFVVCFQPRFGDEASLRNVM
ncbi:hypothetical protein EDB19DRAFT_1906952 [Suillus lakei]|nr:hypothetical protein EDB19DRAFT_1906952 [Suillus lakei]